MEPRKSSWFSVRRLLQLLDEFLDVAGHAVESFGQLADFRGALHRRALVKFAAADGQRGGGQSPNRRADADGKQIAEDQRRERDDDHEFERLGIQFRDARIFARLVEAALRHHGPVQVRNRAVGSDHFLFAPIVLCGKPAQRFGRAKSLRQPGDLSNDGRTRPGIRAGHELARVRMSHDVPAVVHDEDHAPADAGFLQPPQDSVQRYDRREHPRKLIVHFQRHGHDERGPILSADRQRIAAKYQRLQARCERALQRLADKWILVRLEVAGPGALGVLAHGGQVQNVGIAGDEIFKHAGHLGSARGIVDLVGQVRERQNLPFADQLLVEVGVEQLDFFPERPGHFGLLHALGVGQFCLAKLQNLAVIERQRQHADQQHCAQHQPEDSRPAKK